MDKNVNIVEGVILNADFGYGMKFNDSKNLFLKLEIQAYNGYSYIQLFNMDTIPDLLNQFSSDIYPVNSVQSLIHRKVYLLTGKNNNSKPSAVSGLNPEYGNFKWVYNNNWD